MNNLQAAFKAAVPGIIKNLAQRDIEAFFYENSGAMVEDILKRIPVGSSITWGGSQSIVECGLTDAIHNGNYTLLDRTVAKTPEEKRAFYGKAVMADIFLMSTNAITYDGELINIDGNGNRLACLMQGPDKASAQGHSLPYTRQMCSLLFQREYMQSHHDHPPQQSSRQDQAVYRTGKSRILSLKEPPCINRRMALFLYCKNFCFP